MTIIDSPTASPQGGDQAPHIRRKQPYYLPSTFFDIVLDLLAAGDRQRLPEILLRWPQVKRKVGVDPIVKEIFDQAVVLAVNPAEAFYHLLQNFEIIDDENEALRPVAIRRLFDS